MIFCNRSVPENLDFSFNGKSVPIITSHKHLGVTFSNDAKWNNHVDNIKNSVSKHLNILRKLKYRLPLKEESRFSGTLRLEKIMICVLSGLNDISHFLDHISISFKS
jgi:hypothetical protein